MLKMAAGFEDDDDFYGAACEMDDQMLIEEDEDNENMDDENDRYERELQAKEAEFLFSSDKCSMLESEENSFKYRYFERRKSSNALYPPERKPPIFDFFTVLTAFIVAVILAYYTISTY